jgi:hypothetical protein
MSMAQIVFAPLLPWPLLAGFAAAAVIALVVGRRARGLVWRACGFAFLLGVLAGPHWEAETTTPLPDIAVVVVDHSQSMQIGNRAAMAARALAALRASAKNADVRVVEIPPADNGGTALFAGLHDALAGIPPAQLAGVIAITDGEVSDAAPAPDLGAPLSTLIAAAGPETDRELRLLDAPSYGLAGQTVALEVEVLDHGVNDDGAQAMLSVSEDGKPIAASQITVGQPMSISLPVSHPGPCVIAASVSPLPGEVSAVNNQAAFTLNGVQKRLNILLVSGSPAQGERSWRVLLKSDPAVQVVHFTILRNPGELIDADPQDLALVPFPVRQLFETDLQKFDLIILDRFVTTGLLPPDYLANIANYVQNGGALLAEFGPEFETGDSLALTPLSPVWPAAPVDPGTIDQAYSPAVTALGARHPVTAPLAGTTLAPWYRVEAATPAQGDVLMSGADDMPLLVLAEAGKGRVGMLMSDQFWLWTRGGVHDGPALPLLRRIVHWLLREPALEAESLTAGIGGGVLTVTRQTLAADDPGDAAITGPDGGTVNLAMKQTAPGHYTATLPAPDFGVWTISEGGLTAYAVSGAANEEEYQDLAATDAVMSPLSRKIVWLGQTPAPDISNFLIPRHATEVTGTSDIPLLPPVPAMVFALALLFGAWWRETR